MRRRRRRRLYRGRFHASECLCVPQYTLILVSLLERFKRRRRQGMRWRRRSSKETLKKHMRQNSLSFSHSLPPPLLLPSPLSSPSVCVSAAPVCIPREMNGKPDSRAHSSEDGDAAAAADKPTVRPTDCGGSLFKGRAQRCCPAFAHNAASGTSLSTSEVLLSPSLTLLALTKLKAVTGAADALSGNRQTHREVIPHYRRPRCRRPP